jgi:lipopolysaccharide/colanic/teichoic acid biosynthesis glycosyltransferase
MLDVGFSLTGLIVLSPVLLCIAFIVALTSGFPVFYLQNRVGREGKLFRLIKFRTMRPAADLSGELTVGGRDPRITRAGYVLRKFKLDELPQLWHVFTGQMSLVGPRPEVPRYVALYTPDQRKVLTVRPGITDEASIVYSNESDLLKEVTDPEKYYVDVILPDKIRLNLNYIENQTPLNYLRILLRTLMKISRAR